MSVKMGLVHSANVHHSSLDVFDEDRLVLHFMLVVVMKKPAIKSYTITSNKNMMVHTM